MLNVLCYLVNYQFAGQMILKKLSFDGRYSDQPWRDQVITTMGYHYYMPIETAKLGLEKIDAAIAMPPKRWTSQDYPNLQKMPVFLA